MHTIITLELGQYLTIIACPFVAFVFGKYLGGLESESRKGNNKAASRVGANKSRT